MPYYYKYIKYKNKYLDLKNNYMGGSDNTSQPLTNDENNVGIKENKDSEGSPKSLTIENMEPEILNDKDIEKISDKDLKKKYKTLKKTFTDLDNTYKNKLYDIKKLLDKNNEEAIKKEKELLYSKFDEQKKKYNDLFIAEKQKINNIYIDEKNKLNKYFLSEKEKLTKLLNDTTLEKEQLNKKAKEYIDNINKNMLLDKQKMNKVAKEYIDKIITKTQDERIRLNTVSKEYTTKVKDYYTKQFDIIKKQYEKYSTTLTTSYTNKTKDLNTNYSNKIKELETNYNTKINLKEKQNIESIATLKAYYENMIKTIKEENKVREEKSEKICSSTISLLQNELKEKMKIFEEEKKKLFEYIQKLATEGINAQKSIVDISKEMTTQLGQQQALTTRVLSQPPIQMMPQMGASKTIQQIPQQSSNTFDNINNQSQGILNKATDMTKNFAGLANMGSQLGSMFGSLTGNDKLMNMATKMADLSSKTNAVSGQLGQINNQPSA